MIEKILIASFLSLNSSKVINCSHDPDYYMITNFNMPNYFEHLSSYSPSNDFGTCSAIAIIQLLTYYDTFLNDDIIPEQYDKYANNITTLNGAYQVAPGVERFEVDSNNTTLYDYVDGSYTYDYQSYFLRLYNLMRGTYSLSNLKNVIDIEHRQSLMNYLFGANQVTVTIVSSPFQISLRNALKSEIDAGRPVIAWVKETANIFNSGHEVVAYAYDSSNIYANYGWNSTDTHNNILTSPFDTIYKVIKFNFNSFNHLHSNNYKISGNGYCGCNPNNPPF